MTPNPTTLSRRSFLRTAEGTLAATWLASAGLSSATSLLAAEGKHRSLKKAVKYGMIKIPGSIEDKFNLIKSLGFLGVEMDAPTSIDKTEAVRARDKTGIQIHGCIDAVHWQTRLSDPDPAVRAKAVETLKLALQDAKFLGATTVLVVPGKFSNPETENYEQVYERSQEGIRKALPVAEQTGVKIAVEVVWNNFITKPDEFVAYLDAFQNPMVGGYLDMSNMLKYGVPDSVWVRKLGKRMLKFDFKGWKHDAAWTPGEKGTWVDIGDGDENWPEVLKALDDIGYHGWATAEVSGGGRKELQDVADRMNRILDLGS